LLPTMKDSRKMCCRGCICLALLTTFCLDGCASLPLYKEVGLKDEASLRSSESIPTLVKALEEDRLGNDDMVAALKVLAKFGKQAAPALPVAKRLLRLYKGVWSRSGFIDQADAAADVLVAAGEPDVVGPLFAAEMNADGKDVLTSGQCATYMAALRGLAAGNYYSAELVTLLKIRVQHPMISEQWGSSFRTAAALVRLEALMQQQAAAEKKPEPVAPANAPQAGVILAVFGVEDATGLLKKGEREQLQDFLAARLTELARYKVVPREQLKARLLEQKADSFKACYDASCQIELGREVAAQKTVATRILKVGTSCVVTCQIYDLKTATTEKAATVRVDCSSDKLLEGIDQIARQLVAP